MRNFVLIALVMLASFPLLGQVTIQFRVNVVNTNVSHNLDGGIGSADPTWVYQITDAPAGNTGSGSYSLTDTSCLTANQTVNNIFFNHVYNCPADIPTSYSFTWSAYDNDGLSPASANGAYGTSTIAIPAGSIAIPQAAFTNIAFYTITVPGVTNCVGTGTTTWRLRLQYRTLGTNDDTVAPTITCPPNQTGPLGPTCDFTLLDYTGLATTSDNCASSVLVTQSPAPGTAITANQLITLTANDGTVTTNPTSTCTFNVLTTETIAPVINCPANIAQNNDVGLCGASVTYATPVGTDNCAGPVTSLTAGQASGTVFPVGTTLVTYQVTDANSNTASCSFNVTVNDTENPSITCPANSTQGNSAGVCGATVTYATPVGTDNCAGAVTALTAGQASGTVFPLGTTAVSYQVTDAVGNTASCSFNVTVNDTENPTITCPANITQANDLNVCGATITYATPVGTDNCPAPVTTLSAGQASGTFFATGTTAVSYLVTDAVGNTGTCSFNVTVDDTQNPVIVCPADIIQNNDPGDCGAIITYAAPVGTDNCPAPVTSLTAGQASGTLFPIGTTIVTYTVTDASSNTAACSFAVTIDDVENPSITCPADITQNNDATVCGATITYATPVGTDNCPASATSLLTGQASGTVFPIGTTPVTYEVTDASGNAVTCSFDVTVDDIENPAIVCPANITQANDLNVCGATITYATPVGTDNCPAPVTALTAGQASGTLFPIGATTVTYEVTDASSNVASCSFTITVNDTQNPTIVCPANITQANDLNVCGATITYAAPVGTDNCPAPVTTLTAGQASGTLFPLGTTTVTYTVTDASLNTSSCNFTVTVSDTQVPVINCPADIIQNADAGVCGAIITYATPVGTDNCPAPVTALTAGQASGTIFPVGTTTVTYIVTDASSNTATCSFDVTVDDLESPSITCPADITQNNDATVCGATITYATPVGTDNCPGSITSLLTGQASGTVFPIGTTTVEYEVTDASGNAVTCSFDVTVDDVQNPTIVCPANITQANDLNVCGATITYATPVGTDNCPASVTALTAGQASGTLFPIGTTTVTYEVTDASSNTATCSFTVTVNDTQNPIIVCPANITQANDLNVCGATITYATPVGTDNCPAPITNMTAGQASGTLFPIGTTTVTYEVTDASSNVATCSFTVTVNDTQVPVINCPADITQGNDAVVCGAIITYATPVGTDNCPAPVTALTAGQASGTLFPVGTTTVTYEVTDASSNTATCSFDVTVDDLENPTIVCPADITQNNDPAVCGATITYATPVGTDNCPAPVTALTAGQASGTVFPIGTTTVEYEVTDAAGNTATCSFDVTVDDIENPAIVCPANITQANDLNVCGAIVTYATPVGTDNCPAPVTALTAGQASGTLFPIGTTTVTYEVTDASSNTATCSFTVTVNDTQNPVIVCPANITQANDLNVCGATITYATPVGTDNCPAPITNMTAGQASGTLFPIGTTTVTYEVTDASSNVATCSFTVTVNDTQNPTVVCPADITQGNDAGVCGAIITYATPVGTDNCPAPVTALTAGQASGTLFPVGTTTVTYTVTDASSNTATCSFDVTVDDLENPTIVCPADITQNNDPAVCGATITYATPVGTDNCPGAITALTAGQASGTLFPIGTTTVTYEVTDASSNTATCSFDVTVDDVQNPTIVCPANITQANDLNVCGAIVTYATPVGTDNCPAPVTALTAGQASGTLFPIGTTTVTYEVTDASSNTASCSFTVTVNDTQNPVIVCPANITQANDLNVCGATITYATPVGTDNCPAPITNMTAGQASGTLFPIGTTTVTYEVTDASSNTATCSFTVTVNDTQVPVINCPADITQGNDAGVCGAIITYATPVGTDNCPAPVTALTAGQASGTLFPVGTTTVTYEVTDASSNTATCSFDVTVDDLENPTIVCPADITQNNDPAVCGATITYATPVGTDNCPAPVTILTAGQASGTVFPIGTTTVEYEVTDASSNTATCSFDVTVDDVQNPTIVCPANITQANDLNVCGATITYATPVGTDNCPAPVTNLTAGQASGTLFPIGTTTVTYEVTDASSNTATCSFTVTVNDTQNPIIVCPANITQANDLNVCGATITYATPVGTDNCPAPITNMTAGQASGTLFPIGTTTVTYEVTDASSNVATCSFTVTVNDTQVPVINCPADITQGNDAGVCGAIITYATPVGTDNCPAPVTALTAGQASGTLFPVGTTTVTYEVTDASSNTATCSFDVTVDDLENPTIVCPADITQNNDPAVCGATITYATPVGTDNCPGAITALTAGQASGTLFPIGTTTVTYEVTDASGNAVTCSFDVTVDDVQNPTIVCPANITQANDLNVCGATITYATPVGTDNCPASVTALTAGQASGTLFPIGTTTVTYEVTDASSNTATCSFTVTVNDTQNPIIVCPADITQNNDPAVCGATITYATPVGTDNCPAPITNMTAGQASGTLFPIGTTTVTYEVTDASSNVATCSFTVTVNDTQVPVINCPADITQGNDAGVCGAIITYATPVGTDNCPAPVTALTAGQASGTLFPVGTTTVTYEVTDASSNTATCSFDVTVDDLENPTIVCPADITQNNDPAVCGATITYATPVGTDNCPAPVTALTAGQASGTVFPIGTTTVEYEVTDASGNAVTCSFDVTVDDIENPAIVCPANITQANDLNVCGAIVTYATPVGTDNCPAPVTTLTAGQASGTLFPIGTTTVTYEVTDASSNTATCSFTVTVNDTQVPVINCPADITQGNDAGVCGAIITYATPVGTDNCLAPVTNLTAGQASGTLFPAGTTTVTYTVTDASANTATCSFDVTVDDIENPTIVCPADITQNNDLNICGATITYATPVGLDNCAAPVTTLTAGQASGTVFPVGTTTVTYTVTDASSNTATCSFDVTVNDTQNPAIVCPADITQNNDPAVCGATITYATPVGTDNCPTPVTVLTAGQASGTLFPIGTTTVTYEVTDASSNTATCSFDVTVDDVENPTIVCPANITQVNDLNVCGAIVTYATPVGTDNCPAPVTNLTVGQASGTLFPIGTTTVTYLVTDASSNTASCSFTITVNDTQVPVINCPANISQNNDPGICGAIVTYATPVGTDNCLAPVTNLTAGQASGTVFPVGTTTVTYTVTDASSNVATCSFTVTVNDTESPTIICPADITQNNDLGVCGATITYAAPVGVDNCPASVTFMAAGQLSGTVFPTGTTSVTYTVNDASLNTASCTFSVTVIDVENPAIVCPANITQANDLNICGATITYATPVGTDNCPAPVTNLTAGQASGTVFPVGTTTVTYLVTDASSNTASCSFTVTVNDTQNPVIVCPANITQVNDLNVCGAIVTYATPVGTDNCPAPITNLTAGQASGTLFPVGTTTVAYEVTDASSNTVTCSFDVTINDTQNPVIVCPANITQANDLNVCGATITYATPVGTDNCPAPVTALTAGQASGTVFPIGTTAVTYLVTDASGNTATCSFDVTVNDTQLPVIVCPANITQVNDPGVCGATITYATPVGTDNCPAPVTALTAGQASGTVFPVGTTTVTYTVTDASLNTATCSFDVTVDDLENPAIVCPTNITQANDLNVCGAIVTYATPVGTDNCPAPVTALTAGQASGTLFPVGTTTVTYTVTDASSNTASCSFTVTVNDTQNPTIVCPSNITQANDLNVCGATITYATPVGTDNCPAPITNMTAGQASGTLFPVGTTTVTYEVTDASSNVATCSFTVTVNDTQNPVIVCPANITQANDLNVCGATITYAAPVGTDNCPAPVTALTAGQASGTVFPVGTTTVTYTVTDASSNTASCSFDVTVNDTQLPVIVCPADITQANDLNVCGATITYATPVGTDNCPAPVTALTAGQASGTVFPVGTTTVTYTVTDASSNTATCSFDVTVNDTQLPVIVCPANITQANDLNVCGATITYATPVGTDNCPAPITTLTAGQASGTLFPVGTTTVTYTVTDASSNTASCSFTVTVNDTQNPTIVCPANITQANDLNVCGAIVTYATPVGTDNCPAPLTALTTGQASGTLFPVGLTTVTYLVTDASGNTATCNFDVVVVDAQNPVINCPANITQNNDLGVCGAAITYATPVGTDNCPAPVTVLTAGQASGTVFPVGTTTVTYLVTDASGNTATCSFDVTVNDTQGPVIICPSDITQVNDPGVCGATIIYATPVGTDNCPGPVTVLDAGQASGTVFPVGTTTVSYIVTDASSNVESCSFNVTVNDLENPTIICPPNITQNNDLNVCGATITYAAPVISDNCPGPILALTAGQASGTVFPVGTTTVSYDVYDISGNMASCNFTVTVNDTQNPVIVCPANITQANDLNVCGATVTYATPVGTDNCPAPVTALTAGQASGTLFPIGTTTVTYLVTDASGNTATCSFDVTVNDTQNPVIVCPANITQANDLNVCGATITYATPVGTDNCPAPVTVLTAGQASGTVFPVGTTTVTYTVTDASGNTATCSFDVTVNDTQLPVIVCPADITQANDLNVCGATITYATPVGTDNCPAPVTALTAGQASGTVFPVGTTTVTYLVTDASGNTATCSFDVTVNDTQNPAIVCPADITQANDLNVCGAIVTYATPVGTDNCPAPVTTLTAGQASGTLFPVGTTTVTYLVTDASGNTASCSFDVTVNDTQNPTIICPANITQSNDLNICGATITYATPVGVDNCPAPLTTLTAGQASGTLFPIGTTTVTYLVTDASGNTASCSFDVTVNDTQNPVIVCPADITQSNDLNVCGANITYANPVGTDNCPAPVTSLIAGQASGTVFPIGTTTVTYLVTDASGNTASCSFNVTVNDTQLPVIVCPSDITQSNDLNVCGATITYATPVGTDNCPAPVTVLTAGQASGTVFAVGTTVVSYLVTDASGNTATCSFNVTVNDTQNPVVNCPADITQNNDINVCGAIVTYATPVGTDNCPGPVTTLTAGQASGTLFPIGTTTVTYLVTDAYGNTGSCSFDVTVNDVQLPVISCPSPITQVNDAGVCGAMITYATPVGTDNCPSPITTLTAGQASGTVFPVGTTTVTYLVTDASGNTANCSFTVAISDTENPVVVCPADVIQSNDPSICGSVVNYLVPVGVDNCPGVMTSLIAGQSTGTVFPVGTTTVSYLAFDVAGNINICSFDVTVSDSELPVIICPPAITQSNDATLCGATVTYAPPFGFDNCTSISMNMTSGLASGSFFPIGTTTVTFEVTDLYANTASCSFPITVIDAELPALTCPPAQNVSFDASCQYILLDYTAMSTYTDNCVISSVTQSIAAGTPISGPVIMSVTAIDVSGNISTCNFGVLPVDDTPPTIVCPPDQTVYLNNVCEYSMDNFTLVATMTDNCGIISTSQLPLPGSILTASAVTTLITEDAAGNADVCSFNITVLDTISPAVNCPAFPLNVFFDASCEFIIPDYSGVVSVVENCGISSMIQTPAIGTAITANQLMTFDVIDLSGNANSCSFMVIPSDTIAPTIGCPPAQTQYFDNTCFSILDDYTPLAITNTNCEAVTVTQTPAPGLVFNTTQTIILMGTDASGNSSFCFFNVGLTDTIAPDITCPSDIATCDNVVTFATPVATDNCDLPSVTQTAGLPSGSTFPDGLTVITFTATDSYGNSTSCSFNIFVNEKPDPTAVVTDVSCNSANDGSVDVTVTGGIAPYTFDWDNDGTGDTDDTEDLINLGGGIYSLIVYDSKGCVDSLEVTILEPSPLQATADITDITCYGVNDGSIVINTTGGTLPYTYNWTPSNAGNAIYDLPSGAYDLTIVDGNGCPLTMNFTLDDPDSIAIDAVVSQYPNGWQISCEGCYDGSIDVNVTGGIGSYGYDWSTGSTNEDLADLPAGTYILVVTDENGCTNEATFILDQPLAVVMSNAFSPNGDGLNDYFQIKNIDRYPNNKFVVMNRWGDVIYKAEPYANDWYGQGNSGLILYGDDVPEGSYYFILDLGDGSDPIKGFIVIKR